LIAHELCPGHHEHADRSRRGPLAPMSEFAMSPSAFEGWALYAEAQIRSLDDALSSTCEQTLRFYRIRRLMPAVTLLTTLESGGDASATAKARWYRAIPAAWASRLPTSGKAPWPTLSYAVGFLETERVLENLKRTVAAPSGAALYERFLSYGPIAPENAARLVRDEIGAQMRRPVTATASQQTRRSDRNSDEPTAAGR